MLNIDNLFFRQLFDRDSCTYTYLLADTVSHQAIIIDPVIELVERDTNLINQLEFKLVYCLNTHMHADHITGTGRLKQKYDGCKSVISAASGAQADWLIADGDVIKFGEFSLRVLSTPGHTEGCVTYVLDVTKMCFTGDALLIRGCGRTDFQGGSSDILYTSVHTKLFTLPDCYTVYPAHDYKGQTCSTIGEERTCNSRLTLSRDEFIQLMANLQLPYPKKIDQSLPANRVCGLDHLPDQIRNATS